ncbi:MAG: hypothetical protein ACE147_11510 [Candidatus Methylomirabilales bacterium]
MAGLRLPEPAGAAVVLLWPWGIAGALPAMPMLKTFKIFCDNLRPLAPAREFPGR